MAKDFSYIDEDIFEKTPKEFKELDPQARYTLVKTGSTRENYFVVEGDRVTGSLEIINVKGKYGPGVRVSRSFKDYIRTSPIVKVDKTLSEGDELIEIQFQTEGGFYTLRKLKDQ